MEIFDNAQSHLTPRKPNVMSDLLPKTNGELACLEGITRSLAKTCNPLF